MMTEKQQQAAAALFAEEWKGRGYEKGESQPFWMALLHNVYGVEHAEKYISFENQVKLSNTSFIDGITALSGMDAAKSTYNNFQRQLYTQA